MSTWKQKHRAKKILKNYKLMKNGLLEMSCWVDRQKNIINIDCLPKNWPLSENDLEVMSKKVDDFYYYLGILCDKIELMIDSGQAWKVPNMIPPLYKIVYGQFWELRKE